MGRKVLTWRTFRPINEVLAPTLAGHAGGPSFGDEEASDEVLVDALETMLDDLAWEAPAVAGNSLGGYVAMRLAERGRARSVVTIAPAGGWADDDPAIATTIRYFRAMAPLVREAAPQALEIAATPEGRKRATAPYASNADPAVRFRAEFPQAEWIEIDGVGHCPQLDHPTETAELIAGFSA